MHVSPLNGVVVEAFLLFEYVAPQRTDQSYCTKNGAGLVIQNPWLNEFSQDRDLEYSDIAFQICTHLLNELERHQNFIFFGNASVGVGKFAAVGSSGQLSDACCLLEAQEFDGTIRKRTKFNGAIMGSCKQGVNIENVDVPVGMKTKEGGNKHGSMSVTIPNGLKDDQIFICISIISGAYS